MGSIIRASRGLDDAREDSYELAVTFQPVLDDFTPLYGLDLSLLFIPPGHEAPVLLLRR